MGKSGGGKKNEKRFKYNSKPQPKSNTNFANKLNDGKKNGYDPNKTVLTDLSARGSTNKLTALQQKFKQKLEGGRFRYINEKLYTNSSGNALTDFQKDPSLFDVYHEGYRKQVKSWPVNPLDIIIKWIRKQPNSLVIADMGCGEARLACSVRNKVHSFDLVDNASKGGGNHNSLKNLDNKPVVVTACDISNVPLPNETVDIVVFCLSLMGTNMMDFVKEAHRILKPNGVLKIVEVRSRFHNLETQEDDFIENKKEKKDRQGNKQKPNHNQCDMDGNGIPEFIDAISPIGFDVVLNTSSSNDYNKMFFFLDGKKLENAGNDGELDSASESEKIPKFSAKPCLYKRR